MRFGIDQFNSAPIAELELDLKDFGQEFEFELKKGIELNKELRLNNGELAASLKTGNIMTFQCSPIVAPFVIVNVT